MSQHLEETVSTDMCSTNYYVNFGKDEVFSCQMTVRGNPTEAQLRSHIRSAVTAMKLVIEMGGHAKPAGKDSQSQRNERELYT